MTDQSQALIECQQTYQGLEPIKRHTRPFLLDEDKQYHFLSVSECASDIAPFLDPFPDYISMLYLRVSRCDVVWVFSPACNASQLCRIQAVSISHILSLC